MNRATKSTVYSQARQRIEALIAESADPVAAMSSTAAVLFESIPAASWVGFYRVVGPELLRVGPYQGPVGCLEISFDRGVCGAAARRRRTQIVPDVNRFPGHIACDSRTLSEIVVPVFGTNGDLVAVLDLDSHQEAAFDEGDREHLEGIVQLLRPCFSAD